MSGHPDSMSQDEENQEDHLISLSQAQVVGESLYIVHQVDPEEEEELAQQIHLQSDQQEEQQVIEMDEFIKMRRQENRKIASEKKLKEYRIKKDPERDMAKTKRHSFKNFNDSWLDSSVFKHWLQKHPHSNTKAICKVCNKVLLAGKSELMKHGSSQKHLKFLRVSKGMIKEDPDEESNDEGDAGNGFDEAWLEETMFKGWVSPHPDSMYKALCKACNQVLLATKSELTKHRNAKKHRDNMNSLISQDYEFFDTTNGMEYGEEDQSMNQDTEYTIEEDTEVQTETSETPVRVYRVKPATGSTTITTPSLSRTHATGSRSVADEPENQAIVTQPAPHWKGKAVVNGHIQEIKLSDYKGRYLVMFFYPQDFSTVCSTEILALGDVISAFRVVNCEVIAISVDSHLAHLAWTKTLASSQNNESKTIVPLLSDSTHGISKAYGCYHAMTGHSLRAYYIIDKRGILRASNISDVQVGRNLKEILRLVEAFQLVDTTNTQCPVNWTMGQPSVKVTL